MHRRLLAVFTLGTLSICSGCYKRTIENNSLTITNEWWVPALFGLAGLAAIALGIFLIMRKFDWYWAIISIVLGVMSLAYFTPDSALTKVVINDKSFYSSSGFLFLLEETKINFQDVQQVTERVKESTGRRGRKEYTNFLVFNEKDGTKEELKFNGVIKEALPELLEKIMENGIEIRQL